MRARDRRRQFVHLRCRQRSQPDVRHGSARVPRFRERVLAVDLLRPVGHHGAHLSRRVPGQVPQQPSRLFVRPLRVFDDQQHRPRAAQQLDERAEHGVPVRRRVPALRWLGWQAIGDLGQISAQCPGYRAVRGPFDDRLFVFQVPQCVDDGTERDGFVESRAPADEYQTLRGNGQFFDQSGLPDARFTAQQHDTGAGGEYPGHRGEFVRSSHQRGRSGPHSRLTRLSPHCRYRGDAAVSGHAKSARVEPEERKAETVLSSVTRASAARGNPYRNTYCACPARR